MIFTCHQVTNVSHSSILMYIKYSFDSYLGPNSMFEHINLVEIMFLLGYHCTLSMQTHCHVLLIKVSYFMVNFDFLHLIK
jgi:hypothetical protein